MTDERCETHVVVELDGRRQAIHFQEWWIRHRAGIPAQAFVQVGLDEAQPAPGVLEAIGAAELVLIAPSNPVVSIGTILGLPEIREAVIRRRGPGRRAVADHRRRARSAGWPTRACPRSVSR